MKPESAWRTRSVEGLVIIVSILAAFSIDAWWTNRQETANLNALIDLLAQDISADVTELRFRAARSDSIIERLDRLLAVGLGDASTPGAEELWVLSHWLFSTSQTDPTLSAYEVVRGSDSWAKVPSSLKVALSEYTRGPFAVDRRRDIDALRILNDLSTQYGGSAAWASRKEGSEVVAEQILRYLADPATQSWLHQRRSFVGSEAYWQRSWAQRLPLIADSLTVLP